MTTTSIDKIASGEKPQSPVAKFTGFLERYKPQMALALPKHLNPDRMARLAVTAFAQNPQLQQCTNDSIIACVMMSAQLGLEIGVNGQAYMIPYTDRRRGVTTATFVPGWKGLLDLVNRAGRASAWTGAVRQGDAFEYGEGDRPFINHKPSDDDEEDRPLTHVYAVGRVRGSDWPTICVWSMKKVWKHRDRFNKVGERHYSHQHPEMYARKVVLLQVLKYLPQSVELARAVEFATAADSGEGMTIDNDFAAMTIDAETGEVHEPAGNGKPERAKPSAYEATKLGIEKAGDRETALELLDLAQRELTVGEQEQLMALIGESYPA